MKVRITTDVDLETGDYHVSIKNLSSPGTGIDAVLLQRVWLQVIAQLNERMRKGGVAELAQMN